ncbi:MAG: LamG domain-containing protein [Acidobacteria bacterium]|nr:LamG domain-containing protein [Acidobacteriota bacterium]
MQFKLFLTIITLCVFAVPASAGLLGYYTFEGNLNDMSGNGNNGVWANGGPLSLTSGYTGQAYAFGAGPYVSVPININPSVMSQVTFGAWFNADNASPIRGAMSHDDGGFDRSLGIDNRGGGSGWSAFTGSGVVFGGAVTTGQWQFVAVRYNNATGAIAITVDNNLTTASGYPGSSGVSTLAIGVNPNFDLPFSGVIDNAFVFNEYLTDQQITDIRRNGIGVNPPPVGEVPEPGTFALLGAGLLGVALLRRR